MVGTQNFSQTIFPTSKLYLLKYFKYLGVEGIETFLKLRG